jgi:hypothetical protein
MDRSAPREDQRGIALQGQASYYLQAIVEDAVRRLVLPELQMLKETQRQHHSFDGLSQSSTQVASILEKIPGPVGGADAIATASRLQSHGLSTKDADKEPSATYRLMDIDDRVWELVDVEDLSVLHHDIRYWKDCAKGLATIVSKLTMLIDGSSMSVSRYRIIDEILQGLERHQGMVDGSEQTTAPMHPKDRAPRSQDTGRRPATITQEPRSTAFVDRASKRLPGPPYSSTSPLPTTKASSPRPESEKRSQSTPITPTHRPQEQNTKPSSSPSPTDSSRSSFSRFFKTPGAGTPVNPRPLPTHPGKSAVVRPVHTVEERARHRPSPAGPH